jgi:hypothetical protein
MGVVLVHQPVEDPLSGVPLLGRRVQIRPQNPVDQRLVRIEPRLPAPVLPARLRPLTVQRPPHRPPRDVVLALQRPLRHAPLMVTADRCVQIDLRL